MSYLIQVLPEILRHKPEGTQVGCHKAREKRMQFLVFEQQECNTRSMFPNCCMVIYEEIFVVYTTKKIFSKLNSANLHKRKDALASSGEFTKNEA
jgi:hypothetical protein